MDAKAKTVRDILYVGDQYLIPFFQRHYSWKLKNWQRLWDDLRSLVEDARLRVHFLGPLVCTPVNHMPGETPEYLLIDGQQRLTTLTVLLTAIRDVAAEAQLPELAEDVSETFLWHKRAKGLKRYKVVPRVGDREVLFAIVDGKAAEQSRRDGIVRAHRFFKASVGEYAKGDEERRLKSLLAAATGRLSLVVVTVEGENPYEIFESLNSTGLPLAESDLIRNFIFMRVPLAEQDEFNRQNWVPFEAVFEAGEDQESLDPTAFYRNYLMRDGAYARRGATFVDFKDQVRARDIGAEDLLAELRHFAKFEELLRRKGTAADGRLESALDRVSLLDVTTAYPLLMHLLAREAAGSLSLDAVLACIADLESFVLRRSICGESTRSYNELMTAAIKAIDGNPVEDLRTYWAAKGWPDDAAFTTALLGFPIYRRERRKCELVLRGLERAHGHKEGPELEKLTIEHVLPQSIDGNGKFANAWQEMLGVDWQAAHDAWLHTIGNLTLTGYNPNLSNRPFDVKRGLFKKSNAQLNKYFTTLATWNAADIGKRGQTLAGDIAKLWPRLSKAPYRPGKSDGVVVTDADKATLKSLRGEYWQEFSVRLATVAPDLVPAKPSDRDHVSYSAGRSGAAFAVATDTDEACVNVELYFRGAGAIRDLEIVRQDETAIESELGYQVEWLSDERTPRVAVFLDSAQAADRGDWSRQHDWLAVQLKRFHDVFTPRILTKFDDDNESLKDASATFWKGFQMNADRLRFDDVVVIEKSKERYVRQGELQRGIHLVVQIAPERNWVWVGFKFTGKDALKHYEITVANVGQLAAPPVPNATMEPGDDWHWVGVYRFTPFADWTSWQERFAWLEDTLRRYRALYDAHLQKA
ncbi:MAG TPA: DUF4268 domain-containing protein [Tepidisphaeraceae bacterium]|nr:DUF4268 domain-containing protein [Tepidisphaeraceae bacterium]